MRGVVWLSLSLLMPDGLILGGLLVVLLVDAGVPLCRVVSLLGQPGLGVHRLRVVVRNHLCADLLLDGMVHSMGLLRVLHGDSLPHRFLLLLVRQRGVHPGRLHVSRLLVSGARWVLPVVKPLLVCLFPHLKL